MNVQMNFEIGHTVRVLQGDENDDYTFEWNAYVSEANGPPIYTYIQAVTFSIILNGQQNSEVVSDPPFRVEASNYQNFELFIELHFRNPALGYIVFKINVNFPNNERIVQKRELKTYIFKDVPYGLGAQLLYYGGKNLPKSVMPLEITSRKRAFSLEKTQSSLPHTSLLRSCLPLFPTQQQPKMRLLHNMNVRNENWIARKSINSFPKNFHASPAAGHQQKRRISCDEFRAPRAGNFLEQPPTRKRSNFSNSIQTPQFSLFDYTKDLQATKELIRKHYENQKNILNSITRDNKAVEKKDLVQIIPIFKGDSSSHKSM